METRLLQVHDPGAAFVGRNAELEMLHQKLVAAFSGQRQLVFICGEPGIGKTTLVDAFLSGIRQQRAGASSPTDSHSPTPDPWISWGQCIEQYGAGEAYLPLLEALSRLGREPDGKELKAVLAQYAPTLLVQLPALLSPAEFDTLRPTLIGATRERMLREMAEALEVLSAHRPLILVLEDLHWSDSSTVELLAYLARRHGQARLLILGTYRPAETLTSDHPLRGVVRELHGRDHCVELQLELLSESEVNDYLRHRFPDLAAASELLSSFHRYTGGNPLFMVTVVDQLEKEGIIDTATGQWRERSEQTSREIRAPERLRLLIEKQLDGLEEKELRLLEIASVAGVEFGAAVLAAILDQPIERVDAQCGKMAAKEQFLQAKGLEEWPDGTIGGRYRFRHALHHLAVYERMSEVRRAQFHRRIAECKETAYGKRASEIAAELAMHFEQGRNPQRAVRYLGQAGQNALRRNAHSEAITLTWKGLTLLQTLPTAQERDLQEIHLLTILGSALVSAKGYGTPEVQETYERAYALCQQIEDTPQLSQVLHGLRIFYYVRADLPKARALGEQLLRLAEKAASPLLLLAAHVVHGETLCAQGELTLAHDHFAQVWTLYDPRQHSPQVSGTWIDPGVVGFCMGAMNLWLLGYPDQAAEKEQEALRLAQTLSHPFSLAYTLARTGVLHLHRGEMQEVREQAETLLTLTQRHGFPFWSPHGLVQLGVALIEQGEGEAGIARIRQGLTEMQTVGNELARPRLLAMLAQAYASMGKTAEGLSLLTEALDLVHNGGEQTWEAEFHRLYGELTLQQFKVQSLKFKVEESQASISAPQAEAEGHFHKALEIAHRQEAKSLELRAAMSLARLWQRQGKTTEARELLIDIYHWFTEGFETKDLQEAATLLVALGGTAEGNRQKTTQAEGLKLKASGLPPAVPSSLQPVASSLSQHSALSPQPSSVFRHAGKYWMLTFAGTTCRMMDMLGLHYLAQLLRQPGQEIHVHTLADKPAEETPSARERLRLNVTRAIKTAIRKICKNHSALGQHLLHTIKTGATCSYNPTDTPPINWQG